MEKKDNVWQPPNRRVDCFFVRFEKRIGLVPWRLCRLEGTMGYHRAMSLSWFLDLSG